MCTILLILNEDEIYFHLLLLSCCADRTNCISDRFVVLTMLDRILTSTMDMLL